MQFLRIIFWVFLTAILVGFMALNWGEPQDVKIWPGLSDGGSPDAILFEWPVGFIGLVFFLAGFVPVWLLYRGTKWRLSRRIHTLEEALKTSANNASSNGSSAKTSAGSTQSNSETEQTSDITPTESHVD